MIMSKIEDALRKASADPLQPDRGRGGAQYGYARALRNRGGDNARMEIAPPWTPAELEKRGIIDFNGRDRAGINAFRQLRTSLLRSAGSGNFTLAVTGVTSGSGTSFVARNLGVTFALDPTKTAIVVDCDRRNRSISQLPGPDPGPGLTEYLSDEEWPVETLIKPTGVPRMRVITVGGDAEGHGEVFTNPRLKTLLDHLKRRYSDRYVIVDTPPIAENADARILAQLCDYVLIVVPYGRVSESRVLAAMEAVGEGRLCGVVLNDDPALPL